MVRHRAKHDKVSVISALVWSPVRHTKSLYFRLYPDENVNSVRAVRFLGQVLRHCRGRVILIWDRGRAHRTPEVKAFLARHRRLTLVAFPPYAPELNPDEGV